MIHFPYQDPKIVVASLMKLAGGSPSFANELNVDAFLEQVGKCICINLYISDSYGFEF